MSTRRRHLSCSVPDLLQKLIAAERLETFATTARPLHDGSLPSCPHQDVAVAPVYTTLACVHGLQLLLSDSKGSILEVSAMLLTPLHAIASHTFFWFDRLASAGTSRQHGPLSEPLEVAALSVANLEKLSTVTFAQAITKAGTH